LLHCRAKGFAAGEFERHFGRVYVVVGAVVNRDLEIGHRIAGHKSLLRGFDYALLDCGNVLPWNRAAENIVDELKPLAARQWFDPDPAVAELPMAAGLLLVAALHA